MTNTYKMGLCYSLRVVSSREILREKEIDDFIKENPDLNPFNSENLNIFSKYRTENTKRALISQLYMNSVNSPWQIVFIKNKFKRLNFNKIIKEKIINWDGESDYDFGNGIKVTINELGEEEWPNRKNYDVRYDLKEVYICLNHKYVIFKMGLVASKKTHELKLYEPLNEYSPNTRYHMLVIAMDDGGMIEVGPVDYQNSKQYLKDREIELN